MEFLKTRFCIGDIAVYAVTLLLSAVILFSAYAVDAFASRDASGAPEVVIKTPDGESRYALDEPRVIKLSSCGISLTVKIENGEVFVEHSDCPDGICVRSGHISNGTRAVICVPARVSITVDVARSEEVADADFIIG